MPFTAKELEEMRLADADIEKNFRLTQKDIIASRNLDRLATFEALPADKQRRAAAQRAYYEANREKVAAAKRAYYEANREKLVAAQRWIRDARRAHGYTQRDLARILDVTQPCICQLETGMVSLDTFSKANKLCEILGRYGYIAADRGLDGTMTGGYI